MGGDVWRDDVTGEPIADGEEDDVADPYEERQELIAEAATYLSDYFGDEGPQRVDNEKRVEVLLDWLDDRQKD